MSAQNKNKRVLRPRRFLRIIKTYPLPSFAFVGLMAGVFLFFSAMGDLADYVWYATLILGGIPIVYGTIRKMLSGKFAADIVAMLAIIVSILLHQSFAGAVIVMMQSGGEALEKYGFRRASSSLEALMARAPKTARRKMGSNIEEIPASKVQVGDILIIRHGDLIPVDGTITSGEPHIDESALTGEPMPVKKKAGDRVLSGSINASEAFEMRTDRVSRESEYAKIVELVKEAQTRKPPIQRLADRYAIWFTPLTLAVSGVGFLITMKVSTVLAVLVVATPCPLIIAVPIAVLAAINKASKKGIIVKSGAAMEQIGSVKEVFFDKTGTITFGTPLVEQVISVGVYSSRDLLYKSACVEQLSSHPLATAIVARAKREFRRLEAPKRFGELPSLGVEGYIDGKRVVVGSRKLYEQESSKKLEKKYTDIMERANAGGKQCSFISVDNKLEGVIILTDQIRPGVQETVQELKRTGVNEVVMLTGDNPTNAKAVSAAAGISRFEAGLLPQDKVRLIKEATKLEGNTAMVGDGINDAPAMATATVGIAMGAHGTAITAEAADVVLLVDDITKVADTAAIGKRMLKIAKQSIYVGIGVSLALMVVASFGTIPPAVGAVVQEGLDVAVILNALRAR